MEFWELLNANVRQFGILSFAALAIMMEAMSKRLCRHGCKTLGPRYHALAALIIIAAALAITYICLSSMAGWLCGFAN